MNPRPAPGWSPYDLDAIPVPQEDTRPFGTRLWDFLKGGGPWGTAQPGQRGTFVPSKINEQGQPEFAFPGIVSQPAESLHSLMTAPLSDLARMQDPDITRTLAEQSFDVASMLPAAGVAATRAAPRPIAQRGMVAASNPDDLNTSAILAAVQGQERPKGITAYHGSPHDFDRFDMSKIGTGEGAQAYGHGLYFAEAEDVAKQYRDTLKDGHNVVRDPKGLALDNALMYGADPNSLALHRLRERGDFDAAIKQLQREADNTRSWKRDASKYDEAIAELERLKAEGYQVQANPGRMYEVRINADPNDFLDWDKPLSQQSEKVRALLEHPAVKRQTDFFGDPAGEKLTGKSAYGAVANWNTAGNQRAGSGDPTPLRDAGIPGIRYLDQGSRVAGEGSRNYVVFDDALVEILRKYSNAPDPTTAAILALLTQQQGAQPQQ